MAWPNNWTDEEFERHEEALNDFLNQHLGDPPRAIEVLDAEYVMMALWLPGGGLGAMNAPLEREKLQKVERLARELAKAWVNLHYETRTQMELFSYSIYEAKGEYAAFSSATPLSLELVSVVDRLVAIAKPLAEEVIDSAPIAGRRNLINVAIVQRLRNVWAERNGISAPESMTDAGPFAEFMIGAFEVLGLAGNPRAAVDSWREFRAKHPERD